MARRAMRGADTIDQPKSRITLGISGHRETNAAFRANRALIVDALAQIFDIVDRVTAAQAMPTAPTRLISPLAQGTDLIAAQAALDRKWELTAPMPFGLELNVLLNACPHDAAQTLALLEGRPGDAAVHRAIDDMRAVAGAACRLEMAEQDAALRALLIDTLRNPDDAAAAQHFAALSSDRAAAAARLVVEQSDLLIAVWDGRTAGALGGTRHTMATALALGVPVLWVDAAAPGAWSLLRLPEEVTATSRTRETMTADGLHTLLTEMIGSAQRLNALSTSAFESEALRTRSSRVLHAYRWIENGFAGKHRAPRAKPAAGAGAASAKAGDPLVTTMRALPGLAADFADRVEQGVIARFAWADAISTSLADAYRGGMVLNFLLSALAIIGGVAYLPLTDAAIKWPFALFEFVLLIVIVAITWVGGRRHWHRRWFQTRRVTEYLRHASSLLLLGVGRSPGRWPQGKDSAWPEAYARAVLSDIGMPQLVITQAYLRAIVSDILGSHVADQARYHCAKAARLTHVHHSLDRLSERAFQLAIVSVAFYLLIEVGDSMHLMAFEMAHKTSKLFTFLGVAFPAIGGAVAGIRYFGDFERFAAISKVAAEKLAIIGDRIEHLLAEPAGDLRFAQVAELAAAVDDIIIGEIESWQAVFATKAITVPV